MKLHILILTALLLPWGANAEEFDIWKEEGEITRVGCAFASSMSAKALYQLLGEPFVVGDLENGECLTSEIVADDDDGPVIGIPGAVAPIAPRCKCPETFEVLLQQRYVAYNELTNIFVSPIRSTDIITATTINNDKTPLLRGEMLDRFATDATQSTKSTEQ